MPNYTDSVEIFIRRRGGEYGRDDFDYLCAKLADDCPERLIAGLYRAEEAIYGQTDIAVYVEPPFHVASTNVPDVEIRIPRLTGRRADEVVEPLYTGFVGWLHANQVLVHQHLQSTFTLRVIVEQWGIDGQPFADTPIIRRRY